MNYEHQAYQILDKVRELIELVQEVKPTGNEIELETRQDAVDYLMRDLTGLEATVDSWAHYETFKKVKQATS